MCVLLNIELFVGQFATWEPCVPSGSQERGNDYPQRFCDFYAGTSMRRRQLQHSTSMLAFGNRSIHVTTPRQLLVWWLIHIPLSAILAFANTRVKWHMSCVTLQKHRPIDIDWMTALPHIPDPYPLIPPYELKENHRNLPLKAEGRDHGTHAAGDKGWAAGHFNPRCWLMSSGVINLFC